MLARALAPQPDAPDAIRRLPPPRLPAPLPAALLETVAHLASASARELSPLPSASVAAPPPAQPAPAPPSHRPPERLASLAPLSPGRHKVEFTIDDDTREKLELCRDLLRHAVPSGSLNELLRRAVELPLA